MTGLADPRFVTRAWTRAALYAADFAGGLRPRRPHLPPLAAIRRLLLFRPEQFGDLITLEPAIRRARELFPAAALTVAARPEYTAFLQRLFPPPLTVVDVRAAPRGGFDLALVFHADIRNLWRARPLTTCLAGYGIRGGAFLLDIEAAYPVAAHVTRRQVELVETACARLREPGPVLPPRLPRPLAAARAPFTLLHPGCGAPAKLWPLDGWRALAAALAAEGVRVVLTGTAAERDWCAQIAGDNLAGATDLLQWAAIVGQAECVIAPDTGVIHLARALDVPSIALFPRPGVEREWGYHEDRHRTLAGDVAPAAVLRARRAVLTCPPGATSAVPARLPPRVLQA